jgi:hypothetical protein
VGVLCGNLSRDLVTYLDRPYHPGLSMMPTKYEDIWTAAKGFYKLEPIVADGGELIIYAPHITQVSAMHPIITKIGYHNRDYFLGHPSSRRSRSARSLRSTAWASNAERRAARLTDC